MTLVIDNATHRARKRHGCDMCSRVIDAGETYSRQRGIHDDGAPYVWKTCGHCQALLGVIDLWDWAGWPDDGIGPDLLWEFFDDHRRAGWIYNVWRRRWQNKWRKPNGDLAPIPAATDLPPRTEANRLTRA